jgi:hypothetical protein
MAVNIEHEDAAFDQVEGLRIAANNLNAAAATARLLTAAPQTAPVSERKPDTARAEG